MVYRARALVLRDDDRPGLERLTLGLPAATSPGRLQRVFETPPVVADAAHNPEGTESRARARARARAVRGWFDFSHIVLGVL